MSPFAHRALAAAALYGILPRDPRDVVVTIDEPSLDAAALLAARKSLASPDGLVAVVISSTAAAGLVRARLEAQPTRTDAFARAATWSAAAAHRPLAPPASASRIREIAAHAASAGLALVEPELGLLRATRTAVDRAVVATIVHGATARPLLFVDERRAPKGGLAKIRHERVLDGWLESAAPAPHDPTSLFAAAIKVLAEHRAPIRGKDLLQRARTRWTEAARSRGERVTPSASDGSTLAKALFGAWLESAVTIYALDPGVSSSDEDGAHHR